VALGCTAGDLVAGVSPKTTDLELSNSRRQFLTLAAALAAGGTPAALSADPAIGLIFPTLNRPIPPEAQALYPVGVRFLAEGIGLGHMLPEDFDRLIERLLPVANKLAKAHVSTIVLMSPPISFYKGAAFNRSLQEAMTRATGLPCITASTAIVDALKSVRARRVAVATVYTDEISLHLQGFLEEAGFEVVTVKGLGIDRFEERAPLTDSITPEELLEFCLKLRESRPEADALLIASGFLPALELIAPLEKRCQIPVVSATPHALRAGVRLTGLARRISGYGTLFDRAAA
jgi:arylmalonate decarboxylase